jgi:hypothetical protein
MDRLVCRTNFIGDDLPRRLFTALRSHRITGVFLFSFLMLFFFRNALFHALIPLFRDSSNFFFPLWAYVVAQYRQCRLPLWNSYLNLGAPLAAENSCAAFYPGTAILGLPIPFHTAYLIFLLVHLSLAAWGIARLVRECGGTVRAASLAAISYPFSGYVLFQIYNPIFLISAAWFPWAIESLLAILLPKKNSGGQSIADKVTKNGDKILSKISVSFLGRNAAGIRLGVFLSLVVLGGDPQTAYHCVVLAFVTWITRLVSIVRRQAKGTPPTPVLRLAIPLGLAILAAFLLAAIQIIPTLSYARVSERALLKSLAGHSLMEHVRPAAQDRKQRRDDTLASAAIKRQSSHWCRVMYDFSTPAYRWIEFIWPNFGGRYLPFNTRWLAAFSPEGRWWTPSLYMGLFPFLLAVLNMRFWPDRKCFSTEDLDPDCQNRSETPCKQRAERIRIWFSWVSTFSLLAALGWYGPAGILEGLRGGASNHTNTVGLLPPMGGVYWLLTCLLPGYQFFRYPSKWLVLATLGLSVLGALAMDRIDSKNTRRLTRVLLALVVAGSCVLVIGFLVPNWWVYARSRVLPDPVFGSFAVERARWETLGGLASLAVLIGVGLAIVTRSSPPWRPTLILFLTAMDLALHNSWMVFSVDVRGEPQHVAGYQPPLRFWQKWCDYPKEWLTPSSNRIQELHDWEHRTSAVRWGSVTGHAPLESYGTLLPGDYYAFLAILHEFMNRHGLAKPPEETLALLGAISNDDRQQDQTEPGRSQGQLSLDQPRYCFLSHNYVAIACPYSRQPNVWQLTELVFFPEGRPRGPSDPLVVEASESNVLRSPEQSPLQAGDRLPATGQEFCHIHKFQPGHVTINVTVTKPGILVLAEQFLPGWRVRVQSQDYSTSWESSPLRVNRLLMGVALPPGQWQVTWSYRAPGLGLGAAISGMAWLSFIIAAVVRIIRAIQGRSSQKSDYRPSSPHAKDKLPAGKTVQ